MERGPPEEGERAQQVEGGCVGRTEGHGWRGGEGRGSKGDKGEGWTGHGAVLTLSALRGLGPACGRRDRAFVGTPEHPEATQNL